MIPPNLLLTGLIILGLSTCATRQDLLEVQEELYFLRNQIQTIKQNTEEAQKLLTGVPSEIERLKTWNAQILAELDSLDRSVIALQDATNSTRADLGIKLSAVRQDAEQISSKLDDNSYRTGKLLGKVESLTGKMTEISEKIGNQAQDPSSPDEPDATEIFNNAYRDMSKGNAELAIQGFQAFLQMYPDKELADYCQYYLAEISYQKGDFGQAAKQYNQLLTNYPRSQKNVNAQYKLGLCYLQLNDPERARSLFNQIIQKHPNTEEALLARTKLQKLD